MSDSDKSVTKKYKARNHVVAGFNNWFIRRPLFFFFFIRRPLKRCWQLSKNLNTMREQILHILMGNSQGRRNFKSKCPEAEAYLTCQKNVPKTLVSGTEWKMERVAEDEMRHNHSSRGGTYHDLWLLFQIRWEDPTRIFCTEKLHELI